MDKLHALVQAASSTESERFLIRTSSGEQISMLNSRGTAAANASQHQQHQPQPQHRMPQQQLFSAQWPGSGDYQAGAGSKVLAQQSAGNSAAATTLSRDNSQQFAPRVDALSRRPQLYATQGGSSNQPAPTSSSLAATAAPAATAPSAKRPNGLVGGSASEPQLVSPPLLDANEAAMLLLAHSLHPPPNKRGRPRLALPHGASMSVGSLDTNRVHHANHLMTAATLRSKKFVCEYDNCMKRFTNRGHLLRHMRVHTGERPFACTYEGCEKRFSRNDNMVQHYRTHMHATARRQNKDNKDKDNKDANDKDGEVKGAEDSAKTGAQEGKTTTTTATTAQPAQPPPPGRLILAGPPPKPVLPRQKPTSMFNAPAVWNIIRVPPMPANAFIVPLTKPISASPAVASTAAAPSASIVSAPANATATTTPPSVPVVVSTPAANSNSASAVESNSPPATESNSPPAAASSPDSKNTQP